MAATILNYLKKYGDITLFEKPVNEVDSLILCQFAYLKFDGMVPGIKENKPSVTLQELAAHEDYEKLFKNTWFEKNNKKLFELMLSSKRFCNMKMNGYINIIETGWETQFAAITFFLEDGTIYVVYRGTDESIVGWKEDLNMAFLSPVPGQSYSVKYLNMAVGKLRRPFYVAGHSKGGNLAVYAAMNCGAKMQERIVKVYNMDGPGFRPEILESSNYAAIKDRVVKIMPHSSVVGLIFEQSNHYKVVKSRAIGLLQHDTFSWVVKYGRFVDAGDFYQGHKFMNDTMNEWILSLDEEQLRTFIDTLYQVITASEKDNLIDFSSDWVSSLNNVLSALKEVDKQTAEVVKEIVKAYFTMTQLRLKEEFVRGQDRLKENIKRKIENSAAEPQN